MTSARDKLPTRQNKDEDDEAYLARCYRSIEDSIAYVLALLFPSSPVLSHGSG